MFEMIKNYIDGTIDFCPYCGEWLNGETSFIGATNCPGCGKMFCVIECEGEDDA